MVNRKYAVLGLFLGIISFICQEIEANSNSSKKQHQVKVKPGQKKNSKKVHVSTSKKHEAKKSVERPKHYIFPRGQRPKKNKPGVVLSGFAMKGNALVPCESNTKESAHAAIMHVYNQTFHEKHGHVLEVMRAVVESKSKKEFHTFTHAADAIHKSSDDWAALKKAVELYEAFASVCVTSFEKQRLQKKEPELNNRLKKAITKIAHTQSALMYAARSLEHSRLLLEEYAQDACLDQYIKSIEESLQSDTIQHKFNTTQSGLVQARNRLVALCILLEGAVVHYCAVKDALVTDMEKKSLPAGLAIEEIIQELQATISM